MLKTPVGVKNSTLFGCRGRGKQRTRDVAGPYGRTLDGVPPRGGRGGVERLTVDYGRGTSVVEKEAGEYRLPCRDCRQSRALGGERGASVAVECSVKA